MIKSKAHVDLKGVKRKFGRQSMTMGRLALANQSLADMNKFVPLQSSMLRQTGNVVNDGRALEWRTPYARAQFYGSRPLRRGMPVSVFMEQYTTPGTGKRWDLKARSKYGTMWARVFKRGSLL